MIRIDLTSESAVASVPLTFLLPAIAVVIMICGFVGVDSYNRFSGWGLTWLWFYLVAAMGFAVYGAIRVDRKMRK